MLLDTCTATATTAKEGQDAEQEKEESYPTREPERPRLQGGEGPARSCETYQATRTSTTEAGWKKEARKLADGAGWCWLRREMKKVILDFVGSEMELEREAFRMTSGGQANWKGLELRGYGRSYWRCFVTG